MSGRRGPTRPLPERRAQPAPPEARTTMVLADRYGAILVTTRDSVRQALLVDGLRGSLLEAANREARLAELDRQVAATQVGLGARTAEQQAALADRYPDAPRRQPTAADVAAAQGLGPAPGENHAYGLAHDGPATERPALPLYRDHGDPT